jgi:hypothetical protein
MNHVLLAIDADDGRAVDQAEAVQDLFDAESTTAHLLHVFTDNPQGASVRQLGSVRRAATALEEAGTELQYHERSGDRRRDRRRRHLYCWPEPVADGEGALW